MKDNKDKEAKEFMEYLISKYGEEYLTDQKITEMKKSGKLDKEYINFMKEQTRKALHGAKLNYIKGLKHICNDDEELVYYKKGGSIDCGCVKKKQKGGEVKNDSTKNWKQKFYDSKTKQFREPTKEEQKKQAENRNQSAQGKGEGTPPKINKGIKKNCGGSKIKVSACGSKMKKHQQGGSLNGTPFIRRVIL